MFKRYGSTESGAFNNDNNDSNNQDIIDNNNNNNNTLIIDEDNNDNNIDEESNLIAGDELKVKENNANNNDDVVDVSRQKYKKALSILRLVGGLGLAVLISLVIVIKLSVDSKPKVVDEVVDIDTVIDEDTSVQKYRINSDFSITRTGYDAVPYFGSDADLTKNYKFLENYQAIIEPNAKSSITYQCHNVTIHNTTTTKFYLDYDMYDSKNKKIQSGTIKAKEDDYPESGEFTVDCEPYDEITVKAVLYSSTGEKIRSSEFYAVCMYVRREIRTLTDTDLTAAVAAMYKIWRYEEEDGQDKYGENFHSSSWFAELHHFNAAWQDGDHIHEGLGFMFQHAKMSNLFELSMQSTDPSVSLFYWDFTIDKEYDTSLEDLLMFQDHTFGTISKPTDPYWGWTYRNDSVLDAHIQSSNWKKFKCEDDKMSIYGIQLVRNAFGYLRGPWNMNPSPYISRFVVEENIEFPSCVTYYNWLDEDDFNDFMKDSENAPHAPVHGELGGFYGCDMLDELREAGYISSTDAQLAICAKWGFYLKEFYRGTFLLPKDSSECYTSEDWRSNSVDFDCGFACNDDLKIEMIDMMQNTLSLPSFVPKEMQEDPSHEGWTEWRNFICEGNGFKIFTGDHLESASPADPSFWPIHPTTERLLQLKLATGGFEPYDWPTSAPAGAEWVCNHNYCYPTEDSDKGFYQSCCYGHYEFDRLLDFTSGNRSNHYGPTNSEIYLGNDPSSDNYNMPYIYDNFDWDHCSKTDFDTLVKDLVKRRRR